MREPEGSGGVLFCLGGSMRPRMVAMEPACRESGSPCCGGTRETGFDTPYWGGKVSLNGRSTPVLPLLAGLILALVSAGVGCAGSPVKAVEKAEGRQRGVYHKVKRHQTLWRICKTYGVDMAEVARINGIRDVNSIRAGQKIFIPGAEKVLPVGIYIEDLGGSGKKPREVDLASAKGRFIWPVRGAVLRGFGRSRGRRHDGIDISAPKGTPVRSIDSGKVIYSGHEIRGYGNIVIIKHGPVFTSVYAHNEVNLVREGDSVKKGDPIARVGNTRRGGKPYLHFEIRNFNRPVDPLRILP
ncbi:MAG: peptidoglycan DD-metalloendopeptidase family protein [Deltaproteobacteria bacterium]|nr:peptidoglycan DD-metalloendopeptidase family protein [Deltaproteobacteria bacterium]